MDIIALLPFLLFLFFVLLSMFRIKNKLKKLGGSKQLPPRLRQDRIRNEKNEKSRATTGWKDMLFDIFEEIKREIKAAQEKKQANDQNAEPMIKKSTPFKTEAVKDSPFFQPPPIPSRKPKTEPPSKAQPEAEFAGESMKTPVSETGYAASFKNPTRRQLRNAVVWSEILAPPVALRKDQDHFCR